MQAASLLDHLPADCLFKAADLHNRCSSLKPPQLKFLAIGQVANIAHARYDIGFYGRLGIYGTTPDVAVVGRKMALVYSSPSSLAITVATCVNLGMPAFSTRAL